MISRLRNKIIFTLKLTVVATYSGFTACDDGNPNIPPMTFNCGQFIASCCDSLGVPIDPPPSPECMLEQSNLVERNQLALAEQSIQRAARSLASATELSGEGNAVDTDGGTSLAATATDEFIVPPEQQKRPDLRLDNSVLTPSENAALDSIASRGNSLAALSAKINKDFKKAQENIEGNDAYFGLTPGALKKSGSAFSGGGKGTKKGKRAEKSPPPDFFDDDEEDFSKEPETGSKELDINGDRALASYRAPDDYFQRADTRVERDLFHRVSIKMKKIAITWWKPISFKKPKPKSN